MRRALCALVGVGAVFVGGVGLWAPAQAAQAASVDVGPSTVWIDSAQAASPPLVVGPNTTTLQILLPPITASLTIRTAKYSISFSGGDDVKGATGPITATVTIPWTPPSAEALASEDYIGGYLQVDSPVGYDRLERVFPVRDAVQLRVPMKWSATETAPTAVADLSVPGKSVHIVYSHHQGINSPITVRRGDKLTFKSDQPGFFRAGPWGTGYPGTLEARYGWKPMCGRSVLRGCGGGVETAVIPVSVSADGRTATVTFPGSLQPPPAHRATEILVLNWIPRNKFIHSSLNPKIPGTYEVVREVSLR